MDYYEYNAIMDAIHRAHITKDAPLTTQIGGIHYSKLPIQPMEYSMRNNLNAGQHTVVKYVTRYKDKGGKSDLEKAIHTLQIMIQIEYPEPTKASATE